MTPKLYQPRDYSQLIDVLKECDLPYSDISEYTPHFFVLQMNNGIIGSIGLELYKKDGLLRSLALRQHFRGFGYAKHLLFALENYAKALGIERLYLFTTTAEKYFEKHGYNSLLRENLPSSIKTSLEFTSLCPASALIMQKQL